MNVLGFNSTHDGSVALLRDGEIFMALEEERLSRKKHHYGFPELSFPFVLERAGIKAKDLDGIAFYWDPYHGLMRFFLHFLSHLPGSLSYVKKADQQGIWKSFMTLERFLRKEYGFRGKFRFVRHHLAHCASAFYPSDFEEAALLTIDGTGEWTTTLLGTGSGSRIDVLRQIGYPHSLGKVYEATTQYLGFRPNSGEGKVMGLSSYGKPRYRAVFDRMVLVRPNGSFRVNTDYFRYQFGETQKFSDRFVQELGSCRAPESELDQRHADIAASLQECVGDAVIGLCQELARKTGSKNLCLAGGVAHNSVINGRILRETGFEKVFIQPAAHDSGAALGAALLHHRELSGKEGRLARPAPMKDAYLGPGYSKEECLDALSHSSLKFESCENSARAAAELLSEGKIVGWFQGRMEYGPRALGNRSILADPRREEMKDVVNRRVKFREPFRPFAVSLLEENFQDYFDSQVPSPFMLQVFSVRPAMRGKVPAIVHVDGTARFQTVTREANPRFHELIRIFGEMTDVPAVLNTSFNRRGESIVCSPCDAVETFLHSDMDALFLGDYLAWKPDVSRPLSSRSRNESRGSSLPQGSWAREKIE